MSFSHRKLSEFLWLAIRDKAKIMESRCIDTDLYGETIEHISGHSIVDKQNDECARAFCIELSTSGAVIIFVVNINLSLLVMKD